MKNQRNILQRTCILVLAFSVLNLLQGCKTYRIAEKHDAKAFFSDKYLKKEKYIILHNDTNVYHLTDVSIVSGTLCAALSGVVSEHIPYLDLIGKESSALHGKARDTILESEVILYTHLEIAEDAKTVTIPLTSVQKINEYKWSLTGGAKAAVIIGACVGAFAIFIIVYAVTRPPAPIISFP